MTVPATTAVILAGGRAHRLGGTDKALVEVAGRPMLAHVVERLSQQSPGLVINANGDPARLAAFGLPVVADDLPGFLGPLAGLLAGLNWTRHARPDAAWMVSAAVDMPFLPPDFVGRLHEARARAGADLAVAASGGRRHHVAALWPVGLADSLQRALTADGLRAVAAFTDRYAVAVAEWPTEPFDPFFNVNTPLDQAMADDLAASIGITTP
ncbi:molybdenum cofactor guanylyltransferase MobA [Chelatococcus sp. GCM10030263]|uniref:molybdenum cofactor guanylyltransferase MobA n=1 Tax=Chelatococcus sp. GCM10030263 TaxID=3273387 RepID=UPI0036182D8C